MWDRGRASKLIESLILGLPVPQVFLYEMDRDKFLVIDGQQRLMSIYYFLKERFPRKERRSDLRALFDEGGTIPQDILNDDAYFEDFRLKLPDGAPNKPNKFRGMKYSSLGSYKTQFDLRTIRNVIIKQNAPSDDDSSMYEVFNRLNTGGVNLKPQEIRASMYHSAFYEMLQVANTLPGWRKLLNSDRPDLHLKDVEIILRGFAMLVDGDTYAPSMVKFLNQFSRKARQFDRPNNDYFLHLFESFLHSCSRLPPDAFLNKKNRRFNVALYEAAFAATCDNAFSERRSTEGFVSSEALRQLEQDTEFVSATSDGTTQTRNVQKRLARAQGILEAL